MLLSSAILVREAYAKGYAIAAFDIVDLETGKAVLDASEAMHSPVILMIWEEGFIVPHPIWLPALRKMAESSPVPVSIALDHGTSRDSVLEAIQMGCTGVMFDGSTLPFDENVRISAELARIAHAAGVGFEAEIGHVGEAEDMSTCVLTEPADAEKFVSATGVDALAVAIGTAHGQYRTAPQIDFDRLKSIHQVVDIPLVLHGSSGTPAEDIRRCIQLGISKVNIYTDIVLKARQHLMECVDHGEILDWLGAINQGIREEACFYLELVGSGGRAREFE
jgi:fructose-bisphosphate aldolase class II